MKLSNIFKKKPVTKENGRFAEFFRSASPKEQLKVFTEAAKQANEDQRKLVEEVGGI
jgi:hypothetical protein